MPINKYLDLPSTIQADVFADQLLSVFEEFDISDDGGVLIKFHIAHAKSENDALKYAEIWGAYLAKVAHTMARDHAHCLKTFRADGDLFADMCDGFSKGVAHWRAWDLQEARSQQHGGEANDE